MWRVHVTSNVDAGAWQDLCSIQLSLRVPVLLGSLGLRSKRAQDSLIGWLHLPAKGGKANSKVVYPFKDILIHLVGLLAFQLVFT